MDLLAVSRQRTIDEFSGEIRFKITRQEPSQFMSL